MKRVKSRIYSTTELDKKRIAIFSTQDLDELLNILHEVTGYDMSVEKQSDGALYVTVDGIVYSSVIIPGASEPSVRTLRATIPENESQPNFLILV